MLTDKHRTVNL